jgi:hypothetical protein
MDENKKTIIFVAVAAVLLIVALISSPGRITPDAFTDQGEIFFPDFTDPNTATTLEVVDFNQTTGTAVPFKVTFANNRWTIPSHHDYPADAKERLAKTAAGIIDMKREEFRTDNVSDHEACGVIDPLDETAGNEGRGQRVTVRGEGDKLLADFIIGNEVEGRRGFRFVRIPGQNRVYTAQTDVEITTRFEDWIDTDLLRINPRKILEIVLNDYSINEQTLSVDQRDNLELSLRDGVWRANNMSNSQQVDTTVMQQLLTSLDSVSIVGVRPKPEGLSASLRMADDTREVTQADIRSLQNKGFYLSRDGQLLSNEGELELLTTDGVIYSLRFGEVVYGSGLAVTAGVDEASGSGEELSGANRYLFITARFNENFFKQPSEPKDKSYLEKADSLWTDADRQNKQMQDAYNRWETSVEIGRQTAADLSNRFAGWYYVISAESFDQIRLERSALVTSK